MVLPEYLTEAEAIKRVLSAEDSKKYTTKACAVCGTRLNRWNGWRIADNDTAVRCPCGESVSADYMRLDVLRSNEKWLNAAAIPGSLWHHSTYKGDWFKDITEEIFAPEWVHVGTSVSAKARGKQEGFHSHIFKVRVKDSARVDPRIAIDHNDWYAVEDNAMNFDVVRYINRYESVGSISLLVRPSALSLAQ